MQEIDDLKKVLFICTHNSARSQMAEALCRQMCGDYFEIYSAGMKPGAVNPTAVEVMSEIGIDIGEQRSKSVFDFIQAKMKFTYVITLCDESIQHCPSFPGAPEPIDWSFPDPAGFTGTHEEIVRRMRKVRDMMKKRLVNWCAEMCVAEPVA